MEGDDVVDLAPLGEQWACWGSAEVGHISTFTTVQGFWRFYESEVSGAARETPAEYAMHVFKAEVLHEMHPARQAGADPSQYQSIALAELAAELAHVDAHGAAPRGDDGRPADDDSGARAGAGAGTGAGVCGASGGPASPQRPPPLARGLLAALFDELLLALVGGCHPAHGALKGASLTLPPHRPAGALPSGAQLGGRLSLWCAPIAAEGAHALLESIVLAVLDANSDAASAGAAAAAGREATHAAAGAGAAGAGARSARGSTASSTGVSEHGTGASAASCARLNPPTPPPSELAAAGAGAPPAAVPTRAAAAAADDGDGARCAPAERAPSSPARAPPRPPAHGALSPAVARARAQLRLTLGRAARVSVPASARTSYALEYDPDRRGGGGGGGGGGCCAPPRAHALAAAPWECSAPPMAAQPLTQLGRPSAIAASQPACSGGHGANGSRAPRAAACGSGSGCGCGSEFVLPRCATPSPSPSPSPSPLALPTLQHVAAAAHAAALRPTAPAAPNDGAECAAVRPRACSVASRVGQPPAPAQRATSAGARTQPSNDADEHAAPLVPACRRAPARCSADASTVCAHRERADAFTMTTPLSVDAATPAGARGARYPSCVAATTTTDDAPWGAADARSCRDSCVGPSRAMERVHGACAPAMGDGGDALSSPTGGERSPVGRACYGAEPPPSGGGGEAAAARAPLGATGAAAHGRAEAEPPAVARSATAPSHHRPAAAHVALAGDEQPESPTRTRPAQPGGGGCSVADAAGGSAAERAPLSAVAPGVRVAVVAPADASGARARSARAAAAAPPQPPQPPAPPQPPPAAPAGGAVDEGGGVLLSGQCESEFPPLPAPVPPSSRGASHAALAGRKAQLAWGPSTGACAASAGTRAQSSRASADGGEAIAWASVDASRAASVAGSVAGSRAASPPAARRAEGRAALTIATSQPTSPTGGADARQDGVCAGGPACQAAELALRAAVLGQGVRALGEGAERVVAVATALRTLARGVGISAADGDGAGAASATAASATAARGRGSVGGSAHSPRRASAQSATSLSPVRPIAAGEGGDVATSEACARAAAAAVGAVGSGAGSGDGSGDAACEQSAALRGSAASTPALQPRESGRSPVAFALTDSLEAFPPISASGAQPAAAGAAGARKPRAVPPLSAWSAHGAHGAAPLPFSAAAAAEPLTARGGAQRLADGSGSGSPTSRAAAQPWPQPAATMVGAIGRRAQAATSVADLASPGSAMRRVAPSTTAPAPSVAPHVQAGAWAAVVQRQPARSAGQTVLSGTGGGPLLGSAPAGANSATPRTPPSASAAGEVGAALLTGGPAAARVRPSGGEQPVPAPPPPHKPRMDRASAARPSYAREERPAGRSDGAWRS
ncbi:hypothetical protein KFE25_012702 [Diacronema lutheri]|uniref:Uncharacterized protein n=1 Tax=Diacronema lutheri TaxID=2081491 RepID=A0A8J5XAS2_DIALT|nr:hypothetical protein KFE25_012702 [Diacronema lutheri]